MNDPLELSECSAAVPIGVPPSPKTDGRGDQAEYQKNNHDP